MKIEMRWMFEVEHRPEGVFVIERQEGVGGFTRYGPMPPDFAGPFIDERQELLQDMVGRAHADVKARAKGLARGE